MGIGSPSRDRRRWIVHAVALVLYAAPVVWLWVKQPARGGLEGIANALVAVSALGSYMLYGVISTVVVYFLRRPLYAAILHAALPVACAALFFAVSIAPAR